MSEAMRERATHRAIAIWNDDGAGKTIAGLRDHLLAFVESEVRAALAPREQSPEVSEGEHVMRDSIAPLATTRPVVGNLSLKVIECMDIVATLDRLRAENARLKASPDPLDDATMAKLALVCPKGANELAHLRRENARLSAEVVRQTESVRLAKYWLEHAGTKQAKDVLTNALASQASPAQDGDRATRALDLREYLFKCGWNVADRVCENAIEWMSGQQRRREHG